MDVRLVIDICSACGGRVVYDNTGSGREPSHLDGPDDHHVKFGTLGALPARPVTLEDLEAALDDEKPTAMPPPGRPRPMTDEEWGNARTGRRQIRSLALEEGWDIVLEQAVTGPVADQWGRYSRDGDSIGLLVRRGERYVWAIWESMPGRGKFSLELAGATGAGFGIDGPALKAVLRSDP